METLTQIVLWLAVSNKPIAMKDEVWSWINKFVSFNPLLNDYVSYGSPKLGGVCKVSSCTLPLEHD